MSELQVIGGGKMGEALVGGLVDGGWAPAEQLVVVEPDRHRRDLLAEHLPGVELLEKPIRSVPALLAVKPQLVELVCMELAGLGVRKVLSIAAGVTTSTMEVVLGDDVRVVRAMPNTPSLVGRGAAAVAPGRLATDDDLTWAESILGAVGTVVRVDEQQLDAVTGLSGSGPAYVFLVAEALIDAGIAEGLDPELAEELVIATIAGAGELLGRGEQGPAELRDAVTSPGGTTAAGLGVLAERDLRGAMAAAVHAATERSRELG